jgi:hypothetical protein
MAKLMTLQQMFKRYRQPGDIVFASAFLIFALFLYFTMDTQLRWKDKLILGKQPALWPTIAVYGMLVFGFFHWLSSALSERIHGRLVELSFWLRSCEYAVWFLVYMYGVKYVGYLPMTMIASALLAVRVGYRTKGILLLMICFGAIVVIVFKSFLQVKIPGGVWYDSLPDSVRSFALTYF